MVYHTEFKDLDLLSVGNTLQLYGAIYSNSKGQILLLPTPDEDPAELGGQLLAMEMDADQWNKFLLQSDVLDVLGPNKAILRKTQRQIDQNVSWAVYERDGYVCRYCGRRVPLTVDHIILWEEGGQSVEANLVTACRRCNKLRGNVEYAAWIASDDYRKVAKGLSISQMAKNDRVIGQLPDLRSKARPDRIRSR